MRIGDLSARTGVSIRSLRYYEEQGLLTAVRSGGNQRHYAGDAVERVTLIQDLFAANLSSRTICELLAHIDTHASTPETRARLAAERARIDAQITALLSARDRLDRVIFHANDPRSGCAYS
ncbi:MerR family transcriptional regulator [Catenuloplanes japonicus]|uniref:MerR family transcriptional regulator n=1 Tax=Catenuloplanes japonicus TaxID=33876 RepID=UPI000526132B|nr:MerR family transcriptional regulator [Catenuloplanes japonicus]